MNDPQDNLDYLQTHLTPLAIKDPLDPGFVAAVAVGRHTLVLHPLAGSQPNHPVVQEALRQARRLAVIMDEP